MSNPVTVQESFSWHDDDAGVATSTQIGDPDEDLSPSADTIYQLRVLLQNTGDKDETDGYLLEQRVNTGAGFGSWFDITTTSVNVRSQDSGWMTDQQATGQRLGSGTHNGGVEDEDGGIDSYTLTQAEESEHVFAIAFRNAELDNGDIVEIQIAFDNGVALDGYTVTPSSTISGFASGARMPRHGFTNFQTPGVV